MVNDNKYSEFLTRSYRFYINQNYFMYQQTVTCGGKRLLVGENAKMRALLILILF